MLHTATEQDNPSVRHLCPLQVYLGYNNVAALTVLAGKRGWEASNINDKVIPLFILYNASIYV